MIDNKIPGVLKNDSKIIIHTISAQKILEGTKHASMPILLQDAGLHSQNDLLNFSGSCRA